MPCTKKNDQLHPSILEQRAQLCMHHKEQLELCNNTYVDLLSELFFLQHGGNYMDYIQFKKRPSQQLSLYLNQNPVVTNDGGKRQINTETCISSAPPKDHPSDSSTSKMICPSNIPSSNNATSSSKIKKRPSFQNNLSETYEDGIGSQEEILERAKQEAIVIRTVAELRKQGLWSQKRMPKVQEPHHVKAHWDYLLEEMRWLAADFSQERKWKRAAARKLVRMVLSHHKDEKEREKRAEREERQKLRRIASNICRKVKVFWSDIEKVVEYKQRSLLDEKRQKALDLHLNFIVDQTAKYSDWLTEGLTKPGDSKSVSPSVSRSSSRAGSDDDFLPQGASSDDEETIEVEENIEQEDVMTEVALLKQESELPFSELLSQLPQDLIENINKTPPSSLSEPELKKSIAEQETFMMIDIEKSDASQKESSQEENVSSDENEKPFPISLRRSARKRHSEDDPEVLSKKQKFDEGPDQDDDEFDAGAGSSDDEETMQEQEEAEDVDHAKEIEELQIESEMPVEEVLKLYDGARMEDADAKFEESFSSSDSDADEEGFISSECEEIGMDYLLKNDIQAEPKDVNVAKESSPSKDITDVAAEAMSLQPTGHTLATTQVVTPIPSLLRHTLREYQHIGLDWLVTMYDKRLNGILADEMGLGKTIQTIALLAHLACDKGIWGPHLIVVPTSVMLNWEMELKKWCPGFKILTYYGSQKERKMKRTGWTKSNAFHVCITSYKLVLQDHSSFRRKKWRYLILDEAQNIKNFKSQRWQTLLNFNSQRRLLLTGTPLQNNLMELWSLMHFLMPHVFQSHKEFKEWFANPMTGMIEGAQEFNEKLVKRLHKVLRPFLLRRIKKDVEKQMPNKYEHVVKCHLSKRQRFLYEDFMSRAATKETLAGGHFMSVINVLMQLRKVCNHPNLFEPRPIVSSFAATPIEYRVPCIIYKALEKEPFEDVKLEDLNLHLPTLSCLSTHDCDLLKRLKTQSKLIQDVDVVDDRAVPETSMNITEKIRILIKEKLQSHYQGEQTQRFAASNNSSESISASTLQSNTSSCGQRTHEMQTPVSSTDVSRASSTSSITLQYQTAHGTRWATIPNGQIRHLPGGVVQIVTSGTSSRSLTSSPALQASNNLSEKHSQKMAAQSYSRQLTKRRTAKRQELLTRLSRVNEQRCHTEATYLPANLIRLVESITSQKDRENQSSCQQKLRNQLLSKFVTSPSNLLEDMKEILNRFIFVIPKVSTSTIQLNISHPTPWRYYSLKRLLRQTKRFLSQLLAPYHRILQNTRVLFPEARLIEYDCGKLQILNTLLRRFWDEKHRILIFTQMTKVLDILEAFLSYHGYRYLRLDGSTPIEHRMARMERFNNDPRIFCFILSTRSGGIGVNLTGADTVVFYDSDWNPTMDAQAQDRCHRIGQTRDVHIYRLISERTVEENILKKANQKRLLGDLAIEGGGFTTAFFKQQQLKDLFCDPSDLEELTDHPKLTARQKAIEASRTQNEELKADDGNDLEQALLESEEKEDAVAAQLLKQEQEAVMEEFLDADDKKNEDEQADSGVRFAKGSRVEEEMKTIYEELSPIERYALHYLELSAEAANDIELEQAEMHVAQSKKEWELAHLMALKEEEERRTEEADEIFYTREGNQVDLFSSTDDDGQITEFFPRKQKAKPKEPRKKQIKPKKITVRGRGRGRGQRGGVNRLESKQQQKRDESDSSDSLCVDDINREGDPLWREYMQETAGYLMESDESGDIDRWDFSNVEEPSDEEEEVNFPDPEFRESPLWKVAAHSEKMLYNESSANIDYGPCEIMSFSKSGRPRKRNKRLCQDEYEVFSPGSSFSSGSVPVKQAKTLKPVYNIVVETNSSKPALLKKDTAKPPISLLKSCSQPIAASQQPLSVFSQILPRQQGSVVLPFSFIQANNQVHSLTPTQSQYSGPMTTIRNPICLASQQPRQTLVIQQRGLSQPIQLMSSRQQPVLKANQYAKAKPQIKTRDNLFDLDFTIDAKDDQSFPAVQDELPYKVAGDDDLITLNLEPVSLVEESLLEPSTEEERNVFESFASLLE